jgi:hypothetical protein
MSVNLEEVSELLKTADSSAARQLVIRVADELDSLAAQVWAFGLSQGPRRALALVAQMGAELAVASAQLYEAERWYAGAALVRQLIEVEYLLFLFATDAAEAAEAEKWMKASSEEAKKMFSAGEMRKRSEGRFRTSEYSSHCEIGGHPRPRGHWLLREHSIQVSSDPADLLDPAVQWVDLAQHVERMWGHYVAAVAVHSPTNVYPDRFEAISKLLADWRTSDPTPARL